MTDRAPGRTLATLCVLELLTLGSIVVPSAVGLALKINELDLADHMSLESALSRVAATGALVGMLATLLFGWLSDRSNAPDRSRWILGGVLAAAAAAPLVLAADSLGALAGAWSVFQMACGATFAGLYGTLADAVPSADRARASGWFAASANGAYAVALSVVAVLPHTPVLLFLPLPFIAVPVALIAMRHLKVPRTRHTREGHPRRWSSLRQAPAQYWLVWTQRFLAQFAYQIAALFGVFFLMRRAGLGADPAASWLAITVVTAALLSVVASVIAGRVAARGNGNLRPIMAVGLSLVVGAVAVKVVAVEPLTYAVTTIVLGIGVGCYFAVDLATALRVLPSGLEGFFLGWFTIARTLPQSLAPAVAPALLAIGSGDIVGADRSQNYAALFGMGTVVAVVALALVAPLTAAGRERDSVPVRG